ncbi:MAG: glycosyltransferase family 4 protein [Candidatus Sericytochromatia bacterium]|nr:glycosyltransferase family 4 protein [Candidatus Sericytochromatia bacterium]
MPDAALRVCLITREHPAFGPTGGIGAHTHHLARALAARGHAVTVLAHGPEGAREAGGVRLVGVGARDTWRAPWPSRWLGMAARTAPFALRAARALRREGPFDVVEVPEYQGWGLAAAALTRGPVVARLHGHTALVRRLNGQPLDADARLCGQLEAATLRRATRVMASSGCLAEEARREFAASLPPDRVTLVPLGIDCHHFQPGAGAPLRARLGASPQAPVLLYVGRLEARKGVWTLLQAFTEVVRHHREALLVLAGGDPPAGKGLPLREALVAEAHQAGVAAHLRLLGHVPPAELPALYAAADLFVAPSTAEPFGLVYLEAMACGRAVIGCLAGGVPEIVVDGATGWLVPPQNAPALAACIHAALADPDGLCAMGQGARRAVEARFSLEALAARTEACYHAALAHHAATTNAGRPS